ncbi:hypothetical protein M0812_06839 [Anaeramoeba flamelloides]|uniref:BTB domain-containing protein n=1 Tax=Anaeramoeba flamelloides TaxID=1746091 RepID=A0AAV8AFG9_9EUKA|nr:hypothetical protein M0812_06839 [Anaeramoeba flamelloides]
MKKIISEPFLILIGNKKDKEENREVSFNEALRYARKRGMYYIEASAKTAENVFKLYKIFLKQALEYLTKYYFPKLQEYVPRNKYYFKAYHNSTSLQSDFLEFLKNQEFSDLEINQQYKVHQLLIRLRTKIDPFLFKKRVESLLNNEQIGLVLQCIYGKTIFQNYNNQKIIKESFQKIEITNLLRIPLIKDLKSLYRQQEETKDFSLIVKKNPIKIHKLILQARSQTFRNMFLSLDEKETNNQVNDFSGYSVTTVNLLFQFLYTDNLNRKKKISKENYSQLQESIEYYQLNEKCGLLEILDYFVEHDLIK